MAVFTSWQDEYIRAKNALASHKWDEYFLQSVENSAKLRTSYTRLGNITEFVEWLGLKAAEEAAGGVEGGIPLCIGGA